MNSANLALTGTLAKVFSFDNPGKRFTVLRIDIENAGTAAFAAWKVLARATVDSPMRDITPSSITAADGFSVVVPSPRAVATLAAGANTQIALNCTLWDRIEVHASGAGALARVWYEGVSDDSVGAAPGGGGSSSVPSNVMTFEVDSTIGALSVSLGSARYRADSPTRRVAVVGHSIPAQAFTAANSGYGGLANNVGYASYGWFSFWLYLTGYAGPVVNESVAGATTATLSSQIQDAVSSGADLVLIHNGGINDGALSAAQSIENIKAGLLVALSAGLRVVIATEVSTEAFSSSAARIEAINAYIRSLHGLAPDQIRVADFARIQSDPKSADASSYSSVLDDLTYDTTHANQMSAYLLGREAVRATGTWVTRSALAWNNGTNYLLNGRCGIGTEGTVTSGGANSNAPGSWIIDRHGAASVTFSTFVARQLAIRWPLPLTSGAAAVAIPKGLRVRPTVRNGFHYVALTTGTVAYGAAEPTGGALWGTVAASSITWLVVPDNDRPTLSEIGSVVLMDYKTTTAGASDYVRMYQEVDVSGMSSTTRIQGAMKVIAQDGYCGNACLRVSFLDAGNAIIGNTWGMAPQIMSSSSSSPYFAPWSRDDGLVMTLPMDAPAGTVKVRFSVQMFGMGGDVAGAIPCRIGVTDCVLRNGEV